MAEMTIQLRSNPETGKKDITIHLKGDVDQLPHEHEQQHKRLVEALLEKGLVEEAELGTITIERLKEEKEPSLPVWEKEGQREQQAEGN